MIHKKAKDAFDVLKVLISSKHCLNVEEIKDILNLDLSIRRTKDILDGLVDYFGESVIKKDFKNKKTCYKINTTTNLIFEILEKSDDISFIIQNLASSNPKYIKSLEEETKQHIKKLLKDEKEIFIFKHPIIEDLKGKEKIFSEIKNAIKKRLYLKIKNYEKTYIAKPLKLIFTDNNWYLAIEDENENFKLLRIAFIQNVKPYEIKANNKLQKKTYQSKVLEKYKNYFENFQNSMTLYNVTPKKAKILAKEKIKQYFKEYMKKFFPTQRFIEENENGIIFEVTYTQPKEILPFIKKWLPDITVLEPNELKNELKKELIKSLEEL